MPPNSISLEFQKMPTVTVDGKTHKFQADKTTGGFQSIQEGGVTYSLVKDAKGHFQMTITGEPAALEKYNFGVGKGRVTDAKFGGSDSMGNFFKRFSHVGDESEAPKYFQSFSIGGASLKDRTAFLQSGAWGIDQNSASAELQRLEEEAKKSAESKPDSDTQTDTLEDKQSEALKKKLPADDAQVVVTSSQALSQTEIEALRSGVHENYHESLDKLVLKNDTASLREVQIALKEDNGREMAHRILSEKDDKLFAKTTSLSFGELAQKTEANLAKLGLKANPTKGDGNCYFHAVSAQVFLSQQSVRSQVADAMTDIIRRPLNRDLGFPRGLNNQKPTEAQRDRTLLDASTAGEKAWGEDYHCAYVARAFDRPVVLVGPDRIAVYEKDQEVRTIDSPDQLPKNAIILSHKGGNHWESASPINA
jgi:hypothetical protein